MSDRPTVLLLGGTGRTGRLVLGQLLDRGANVRAIVRSVTRVPEEAIGHSGLTLIEADLLSMSRDALLEQVRGCDAIVSCLGHTIDLKGIFGPPRDLVTRAVQRACEAATAIRPPEPVKVVLMSTVSVHRPGDADARRGGVEKAGLGVIRALVPPAKDNQDAADYLCAEVGTADPYVEWTVVRPDTLVEGGVSEYVVHEGLVSSLAKPDHTAMSNVAHFMCELVTDADTWARWKSRLPVVVDGVPS